MTEMKYISQTSIINMLPSQGSYKYENRATQLSYVLLS